MNDVVGEALCHRLADEAEAVRWKMSEIPWERIDRERAGPGLRALVQEIAFSELTTTTATRRFLTEHGDDPDFTQWLSVWFYEETRHPQVLLRWLHQLGVAVDARWLLRGRATAPFMRSRFGTLVTNIISEMVAASSYTQLRATSPEPVLTRIAANLAGDEARHAASFYRYAQRYLERSSDVDGDRRDGLKVLYLWFQDSERVSHPVNEFYGRNLGRSEAGEAIAQLQIDPAEARERIVRLIGHLLGLPLDGNTDLLAHIRDIGGSPDGEPSGVEKQGARA